MSVPRATGILQLQQNIVVQVDLGTSRSALDALLPAVSLPNSDSGQCEAKESKSAIVPSITPESQWQVRADLGMRASVLCVWSNQIVSVINTPHVKESGESRRKKRETEMARKKERREMERKLRESKE